MASGATSSLAITKSTNSTGYGAAGDVIDYSYPVTNTGTTTLSNVGVADNMVAHVSCPDPSLAPGASETCTGTYTVTQADVDAGSVTNTATRHGDQPAGQPGHVRVRPRSRSTPRSATSYLGLVKSTTSTGYGEAGDTIHYSYAVTNTGTTTITGLGHGQQGCRTSAVRLHSGARRVRDLHRQLHDHPGRRGRRVGDQHGDGQGNRTGSPIPSAPTRRRLRECFGGHLVADLSETWTKTTYKAASKTIDFSELVADTGTTTLSDVSVADNLTPSVSCPDSTWLRRPVRRVRATTSPPRRLGQQLGDKHRTAAAVTPYANTVLSAPSAVTVNYAGETSPPLATQPALECALQP